MLDGEYSYTLLDNIKIFWGYPTFSRLMVGQLCSGESIADLLGILCLFRADGRPTLLGESIVESCLTLRGVKVSWSYSSAESTLYLEDRAACTVRRILIAPASVGEGTCGGA